MSSVTLISSNKVIKEKVGVSYPCINGLIPIYPDPSGALLQVSRYVSLGACWRYLEKYNLLFSVRLFAYLLPIIRHSCNCNCCPNMPYTLTDHLGFLLFVIESNLSRWLLDIGTGHEWWNPCPLHVPCTSTSLDWFSLYPVLSGPDSRAYPESISL